MRLESRLQSSKLYRLRHSGVRNRRGGLGETEARSTCPGQSQVSVFLREPHGTSGQTRRTSQAAVALKGTPDGNRPFNSFGLGKLPLVETSLNTLRS